MVAEIERGLYVDDLISGGATVEEISTTIFSEAALQLHKWHSNSKDVDDTNETQVTKAGETYAKQQLGDQTSGETAIHGLPWNTVEDTLTVKFPYEEAKVSTKRVILGTIAKVYDPLGLVSPMTLGGKLSYRNVCDSKVPWDQKLPPERMKEWSKWKSSLPNEISLQRAIPPPP